MLKFNVIGRYFTIENKVSGNVLDLKNGHSYPRTSVVVSKESKGDELQAWYFDPLTDTIRSRQSRLCLDLDAAGRLVINPFDWNDKNQKWRFNASKDVIENIANPHQVLDVPGGSKAPGAEVFATEFHGGNSQKWRLDGLPVKYFLIRSQLNEKVLDVLGGKSTSGSRVILWDQKSKGADSQLWFEDSYGNVRPKVNEKLVLQGTGPCITTGDFKTDAPRCYWVISGNKIVNKENHNEVLAIKDRLTLDGAELSVSLYRGEPHQHWHFEYV